MAEPQQVTQPEQIPVDTTPSDPPMEIADGLYDVVLVGITSAASTFKVGEACLTWRFSVAGKEGVLKFFTGRKASSEKSNLRKVLTALKVALPENAQFNLSVAELVGKTCKALVQNQPGETDPTKKYPRITSLLAA